MQDADVLCVCARGRVLKATAVTRRVTPGGLVRPPAF